MAGKRVEVGVSSCLFNKLFKGSEICNFEYLGGAAAHNIISGGRTGHN